MRASGAQKSLEQDKGLRRFERGASHRSIDTYRRYFVYFLNFTKEQVKGPLLIAHFTPELCRSYQYFMPSNSPARFWMSTWQWWYRRRSLAAMAHVSRRSTKLSRICSRRAEVTSCPKSAVRSGLPTTRSPNTPITSAVSERTERHAETGKKWLCSVPGMHSSGGPIWQLSQ